MKQFLLDLKHKNKKINIFRRQQNFVWAQGLCRPQCESGRRVLSGALRRKFHTLVIFFDTEN